MKVLNDAMLKDEYQKIVSDGIIIDIREPDEYAREHIANSKNIPSSHFKTEDLTEFKGKTLLFHCKAGSRTNKMTDILSGLLCKEAFCLEGGLEQWKRCGLPTVVDKKAPIEIMRQVQIAAGGFVVLGVILALTLSFYFIALSLFIGLGLIFSGVTGSCGMAKLLSLMPWNRKK